jgi:hypothetical protein
MCADALLCNIYCGLVSEKTQAFWPVELLAVLFHKLSSFEQQQRTGCVTDTLLNMLIGPPCANAKLRLRRTSSIIIWFYGALFYDPALHGIGTLLYIA